MAQAAGLDVVAAGHALVDVRMLVDQFPGPDEEAAIREEERGAGGSAVNVAIDVARLGGRSGVAAKIAFDGFGRIVFEELWRSRVDLRGLRISPRGRTGFSIVVVTGSGEVAIYGYKGVAEELSPGEVDVELVSSAAVLHIASLRLDTSIAAARAARGAGRLVSWDPGRRLAALGLGAVRGLLGLVDIVFVNRVEARLLTGAGDPLEAARRIAAAGPRLVVVKLGAEGAVLLDSRRGAAYRVPAYRPGRVVDTTGAGDAFAAAMLLRLARGSDVVEALRYAAVAAGLKVARLGAHSVPGARDVEEALRGWDAYPEELRLGA